MWMMFGILSIVSTGLNIVFTMRKSDQSQWASICALSFASLTLLAEYRLVLDWVNHGDWAALLDVVPSMFPILAGYVIVVVFTNAVLYLIRSRRE